MPRLLPTSMTSLAGRARLTQFFTELSRGVFLAHGKWEHVANVSGRTGAGHPDLAIAHTVA